MSDVLIAVEQALVRQFGHRPQRASVSFVGTEPIDILRFEPMPGDRAYVTLGMSRHPMTGADQPGRAAEGPRAELVLSVHDPTDEHGDVWRQLAVLAAAPVVEGVVYSRGVTADLGMPLAAGSRCTGVVLSESAFPSIETEAGPVALLQATPATATELAWARARGSDALRAAWAKAGTDLLDLTRGQVPFE